MITFNNSALVIRLCLFRTMSNTQQRKTQSETQLEGGTLSCTPMIVLDLVLGILISTSYNARLMPCDREMCARCDDTFLTSQSMQAESGSSSAQESLGKKERKVGSACRTWLAKEAKGIHTPKSTPSPHPHDRHLTLAHPPLSHIANHGKTDRSSFQRNH
jgi:hypothetical protein